MSARRPDGLSRRVRPYLLTGGRSRGAVDLPLEAIVRITERGHRAMASADPERGAILGIVARPLSIAEISAYLGMHLQVARVLTGDLAAEGLVSTNFREPGSTDNRSDLALLERVLHGLQEL